MNPLFCIIGKSGSGKTTVVNFLEKKHGFKQVNSYTTRPPRYEGEIGHIFISDEEFDNLGEMVAYTEYNGHRYGTTAEQFDQYDIYVIDVPGVEALLQKYKTNRPICIIYFDTTVTTRIHRMVDRGDSDTAIISRLLQDEKNDWLKQLDKLVWQSNHVMNRNVELYVVNANDNQTNILEMVLYYIQQYVED